MWSYEKTKLGYKIICDDKKKSIFSFNFTIPYTYQDENIIMYWDDIKINKLVNDLNKGKIPININIDAEDKHIGLTISYNNTLIKI